MSTLGTPLPNPARPKRAPRRWLPYFGLILLVSLIVAGLWPRATQVEITAVVKGPLRATVSEEGKTRLQQRYVISSPVTGQLRRIEFKAGADIVANQTVLAVIDPVIPPMLDPRARSLAEARRDTTAAQLDKAQTAHVFAIAELKRFEKLAAERTVSVQDLESVQWREAAAAKEKSAAESALREAEAQLREFNPSLQSTNQGGLSPIVLKAPINGKILRVLEESTKVVAPGSPLLEVGDPTALEAVIEVLSRDGATILPGTKVELTQWGSGEPPLEGRVRLVEPAGFLKISALGVEEQRVNVIVDIVTPPSQRKGLGDQFRVIGNIITWESPEVLKVETGALFRRGNGWAVYVVHQGRAELREVEAGKSDGRETQILKGLDPGAQVIVYPGERVHPNQSVTIVRR